MALRSCPLGAFKLHIEPFHGCIFACYQRCRIAWKVASLQVLSYGDKRVPRWLGGLRSGRVLIVERFREGLLLECFRLYETAKELSVLFSKLAAIEQCIKNKLHLRFAHVFWCAKLGGNLGPRHL